MNNNHAAGKMYIGEMQFGLVMIDCIDKCFQKAKMIKIASGLLDRALFRNGAISFCSFPLVCNPKFLLS